MLSDVAENAASFPYQQSGSYFHTWNTQLVYFLITNANDLDSISLPDEPVNRHEKFTRIFVAHGWRGG